MPDVQTPTEEDAFNSIVKTLQSPNAGGYGYGFYLPKAMEQFLNSKGICQNCHSYYPQLSPPFYAAAWDLCRRGILRPGLKTYGRQATDEGSGGGGYTLTPFGEQWLKESGGSFDYVPSEPGRFAQMLNAFSQHFGAGFQERSQEAMRCYGAHAFLSCCAMCGAAAESILLAIAIAKSGDEEKTIKTYLSNGGRGRIEKQVTDGKPENVVRELKAFIGLLKYWRDSSAHGLAANIQDNEAFTSLAFLLRFAQVASDRWDELTQ